jgi:hypothetical protein
MELAADPAQRLAAPDTAFGYCPGSRLAVQLVSQNLHTHVLWLNACMQTAGGPALGFLAKTNC